LSTTPNIRVKCRTCRRFGKRVLAAQRQLAAVFRGDLAWFQARRGNPGGKLPVWGSISLMKAATSRRTPNVPAAPCVKNHAALGGTPALRFKPKLDSLRRPVLLPDGPSGLGAETQHRGLSITRRLQHPRGQARPGSDLKARFLIPEAGIIIFFIANQVWNIVRKIFDLRSISLRLYLIIVPATVLAIVLIGYFDINVAARLLDQEIQDKTRGIAESLAVDLASQDPGASPDMLRTFLGAVIETNFYITRIDVFRKSGDTLTRIASTSSIREADPIQVDESAALDQARPLEVPVYQDRERAWKVVIPFANRSRSVIGCVTVISSLSPSDLVTKVHYRMDLFLIPVSITVLVLLLHYLFTRVLTGRIWKLGYAMEQARRGDLSRRAPVDRQDELGAIARLFNETMDEIQRASAERDRLLEEQKTFNSQLQARVQDATGELSAANRQLVQVNQDLVDTQRKLTRYERMAMAGQMAATFAHEVGSPLSAIATHLEMMAEESECNDEAKHRIRLIQEQLNRITGYVEELLSETRAAAQVVGKVQVNQILNQLLLFLRQHLERQSIEVETQFRPDLPEIEANARQLQQVFLNLLNNAADAMPNGGRIRLATRVETDVAGRDMVAVSVADNGIGIAPEEQKRMFEPFFSTKDFRRGTGLGLSIAARIVRQFRGAIALESQPGAGTTFTIRFPVPAPIAPIPCEVNAT